MASLLKRGVRKVQRIAGVGEAFPGEIKDDALYRYIERVAQQADVSTILEIGSSAGGGSTEAFVKGIRQNPGRPTLYCMEVSGERFEQLRARYAEPFVKCYQVSSVPVAKYCTEADVTAYHQLVPRLNRWGGVVRGREKIDKMVQTVQGWRRSEIDYIRKSGVPDDGIARIKRENGIDAFDVVLIDGSEFTGLAELEQVIGARYILLDDTLALKNHYGAARLATDPRYRLVEADIQLRNGYAVFQLR